MKNDPFSLIFDLKNDTLFGKTLTFEGWKGTLFLQNTDICRLKQTLFQPNADFFFKNYLIGRKKHPFFQNHWYLGRKLTLFSKIKDMRRFEKQTLSQWNLERSWVHFEDGSGQNGPPTPNPRFPYINIFTIVFPMASSGPLWWVDKQY